MKTIKGTFIPQHNTEEKWQEVGDTYIPRQGQMIVYEYSETPAKIKIGDGETILNNLGFSTIPEHYVKEELSKKVSNALKINNKPLTDDIQLELADLATSDTLSWGGYLNIGESVVAKDVIASGGSVSVIENNQRVDLISETVFNSTVKNIQVQLDTKSKNAQGIVEDTVTYEKLVPEYASTYAQINSIGGMSTAYEFTFIFHDAEACTHTARTDMTFTEFCAEGRDNGHFEIIDGVVYHHGTSENIPESTLVLDFVKNHNHFNIISTNLVPTKVTAVESAGANLIPFPYVNAAKGINYTAGTVINNTNGITTTVNSDGSFTLNGTSTATGGVITFFKDEYDSFVVGETYSIGKHCDIDTDKFRLYCAVKHADGTQSSWNDRNGSWQWLEGDKVIMCYVQVNAVGYTFDNLTVYPIVNKGATAAPFAPYREPITMPIPEPVEALEGYGDGINESCYNSIEWKDNKALYIQRVGEADMGALIWDSTTDVNGGRYFISREIPDAVSILSSETGNLLCSKLYTVGSSNDVYMTRKEMSTDGKRVRVHDSSYTDAVDFQSAMAGVMLYYELAEPIVTDVTEYFTNNYIEVEPYGSITMVNENKVAVSNSITYYASTNAGKKDIYNNEIFNDYENNIAGWKAFRIVSASGDLNSENKPGYYMLKIESDADKAEFNKLAIGDKVSLRIYNDAGNDNRRYYNICTITNVQEEAAGLGYYVVSVTGFKAFENTQEVGTNSYLCVATKPDAGTFVAEKYAHAEGWSNQALGMGSHAEGSSTIAIGAWAHTEGKGTTALYTAHAEGNGSEALGEAAHAEGNTTHAIADRAHAEGLKTTASAANAHAEGKETIASGANSHTEGEATTASNESAHAEGAGTTASGMRAHAEGRSTVAEGSESHAEGYGSNAKAWAAHAEGARSIAQGAGSHAEGWPSYEDSAAGGTQTIAKGMGAHAEGLGSQATSNGAHAEGKQTEASGKYSHAEGINSKATAEAAHASGTSTIAIAASQTVIGKWNKEDAAKAFILGNGKWSNDGTSGRSNAVTIDWNGNGDFANSVGVVGGLKLDKNGLYKEIINNGEVNKANLISTDGVNMTIGAMTVDMLGES